MKHNESDLRVILKEVVHRLMTADKFDIVMDRLAFSDWRTTMADDANWHMIPSGPDTPHPYFAYDMPSGTLEVMFWGNRGQVSYHSGRVIPSAVDIYSYRDDQELFNMASRDTGFELQAPVGQLGVNYLPKSNVFGNFIKAMLVVCGHTESDTGWTRFGGPKKFTPTNLMNQNLPNAYLSLQKTLGLFYLHLKNSGEYGKAEEMRLRYDEITRILDKI